MTAIIRAAEGADGEDASRTARALNGIGLEGLRRLLSTGRLQFRTVGDEDDDDDEEEVSKEIMYNVECSLAHACIL